MDDKEREQKMAIADMVCDMLHIGSSSRTIGVVEQNIGNLMRRNECLGRVEAMFTTTQTEDGEEFEDCALNWGDEPDEYAKKFAAALASLPSPDPAAGKDARCPYCDDSGDVHGLDGEWRGRCSCPAGKDAAPAQQGAPAQHAEGAEPVDMVLHCPACGMQHVDAPEDLPMPLPGSAFEGSAGWVNPPHRSHLCHGCGHIWRPADVPTNGVQAVQTKGKADSPIASQPADKDGARYRWLARKVSAHGVIDGWAFGFPTHLSLPAPASALRDPEAALGEAIDAQIAALTTATPEQKEKGE